MADTTEKPIRAAAAKPVAAEASVEIQPEFAELSLRGQHRPLVVRVKGKKKKKRKYARGTKDFQIGVRKGTKVGSRIARALASGFSLYSKKANKSSRKKKDGVLRDLLRNSGSGMSRTLRRGSNVPKLLAKTVRKKTVRRSARAVARALGGFMRWR